MNNHEGLAKRFSMNYMDTVGNGKGLDKRYPRNFFNPSDLKRSGKYYLEESNFLKTKLPTPIKRFSMNFLDTLDNPQVVNLGSNTLCNPIFQKCLQNSHPPRLKASKVVLPSFTTLSKIRPDFSRNGFKIEVTKKNEKRKRNIWMIFAIENSQSNFGTSQQGSKARKNILGLF